MKTKLKLFVLIFAFLCLAILIMPNQVFATENLVEVDTYEKLRDALESGKSVKLMDDIKITGNSAVKSSRSLGVAVMATKDLVVDGNGFTISADKETVRTIMEIYAGETPVEVTLKNITITNAYAYTKKYGYARALDTRTGNITLNLVSSRLEITDSGNTYALTVGGPTGPVNINITDSEIEAKGAGYGIATFNPVNMTIEDSDVTGYSALYLKGPDGSLGSKGSNITVKRSILNGKNNYSGKNDSFATVIFENDGGINITIEDSKINALGEGQASQAAFIESVVVNGVGEQQNVKFTEANTINVLGNSIVNAKNKLVSSLINDTDVDDTKVTFGKGVASNKEIPVEYIPAGTMVKKENDLYVVSEIEVDFVIGQDREENIKDFGVGAIQTENVKNTLNESLKANEEVYQKAEAAIKNGEEVNIEIKVEELKQDTIKAEEKEKMTAVVSNDGKVHQYFDISVLVTANNTELGKLTELTDKVKLSMKLPKDLIKEGRKFFILKLHGDKVEKIETTVNGENLEFETNEFSLYALAYEDAQTPVAEEKDETPKMGTSNMISYIWVALATIAVVGIATTKKVGKHSK